MNFFKKSKPVESEELISIKQELITLGIEVAKLKPFSNEIQELLDTGGFGKEQLLAAASGIKLNGPAILIAAPKRLISISKKSTTIYPLSSITGLTGYSNGKIEFMFNVAMSGIKCDKKSEASKFVMIVQNSLIN